MGESKLPLYAFVDESGNTGHNLFDVNQPEFFTTAMVTKGDFDCRFGSSVQALALGLGVSSLHASELGVGRLEAVADGLLALLRTSKASFFVSRVEKRYLLATKIFDTLCDSGENAAISWHHYNIRPLRLMLTFKLASTVDRETAKLFWECILEPNESKLYATLPAVCKGLQRNLEQIPDERSRQILGKALEWARINPLAIEIHTDRKLSRQGHFPNLVAFANLLDGLEKYSRERRSRVARITHDKQSEFEKTLAMWHDLFSNASPEAGRWVGETYSLQKLAGSEFEVKDDSSSPGIQVTDVVLWLYSQYRKGKQLPPKVSQILEYVLSHGWENDFSFVGVEKLCLQRFGPVFSQPLSAKKEKAAQELLVEFEKKRRASIEQYEHDRVRPYMRQVPPAIPAD